jgi:hypothetical protein
MTVPITLRTGDPLWIVIWIDDDSAVCYPRDWRQAFKQRWYPRFLLRHWPVIYSKQYRRWWLQGVYSDEHKACEACEGASWFYFPFLINVAYPQSRVEVRGVFPVRDKTRCSEIATPLSSPSQAE